MDPGNLRLRLMSAPRINGSLLSQYAGRDVRLSGKVLQVTLQSIFCHSICIINRSTALDCWYWRQVTICKSVCADKRYEQSFTLLYMCRIRRSLQLLWKLWEKYRQMACCKNLYALNWEMLLIWMSWMNWCASPIVSPKYSDPPHELLTFFRNKQNYAAIFVNLKICVYWGLSYSMRLTELLSTRFISWNKVNHTFGEMGLLMLSCDLAAVVWSLCMPRE